MTIAERGMHMAVPDLGQQRRKKRTKKEVRHRDF